MENGVILEEGGARRDLECRFMTHGEGDCQS